MSYDLNGDGTPELVREIARTDDDFLRPNGYQLKNGNAIETQAIYGYDSAGRLGTVSGGGNVSSPDLFTYGYTPNSDLLGSVTGPIHTVTNTWEENRTVLDLKANKVGSTVVSSYDYGVNAIGQRSGVVASGSAFGTAKTTGWSYDALGQVTSADSTDNVADRAYQYDAIGNRKKSADSLSLPGSDNYTANVLNQYASVAAITPEYDDDGNATAYPLPAAPTVNSALAWDAENRMTSTTVGGIVVSYSYDAQSRRIAQVSTTGKITLYLYDGSQQIGEYLSEGAEFNVARTYLWGSDLSGKMTKVDGIGGLLALKIHRAGGSGVYYPTYDGNGNITEYLSSIGTPVAHFEYDPSGRSVVDTDGSALFDMRFSTKKLDFFSGLYYYGLRYFDPRSGRWLSKDPLSEKGGFNLYGFVANNAIGWVDKMGLDPWGHHIFPQKYWKNAPKDVKDVFNDPKNRIDEPGYKDHNGKRYNDVSEPDYSKACKDEMDDF